MSSTRDRKLVPRQAAGPAENFGPAVLNVVARVREES
jgi:hypothetical protein